MTTKVAFFQILILISVFWTCQLKKEIKVFDIDGESKLVLKNELSDSIKIKIENWYQIPWQSQMIDTILKEKESIELNLIIQGYSYYTIEIGEKK